MSGVRRLWAFLARVARSIVDVVLRPFRPRLVRGSRRILVPFTRGHLDPVVLAAAIRIARAEEATLVPAYLILVPMQLGLDAPMSQECTRAVPLLEAVEVAASRAGVPVDARIESGRTPIHALERLWAVERFDRIVIPAPAPAEAGFSPKELLWMLMHAPSETVILRPNPELVPVDLARNGNGPKVAVPSG
ncbi:MAG TPA: hypothetical protein VH281_04800 [Gaiellaceae bacterium]